MLENLIDQYGYPALLLGAFLEGEVTVIAGGYLASEGLLRLDLVILFAFFGSLISDQLWFWLGRRKGRTLLDRHPHWRKRADKALSLLNHYPDLWVLSFRFLYGLRTAMPIAIGLSGYSWRRYMVLNIIAALLWAVVMSLAAYYVGQALQQVLSRIEQYEGYILAGLAALGLALWLLARRRRLRRERQAQTGPPQ